MTQVAHRPAVAAAAGLGGGFVSGLLGGGGGSVMIPLMTGPLRMPQHLAHGTSLVVITSAAALAAIAYSVHEPISAVLVASLGTGALLGAFIGARGAAHVPAMHLRQLFGVFLILVSLRLLLWDSIDPLLSAEGWREAAAGAGIGLAGGIASGALGVGGGSIFVPGLVLGIGIGQHEAQGISLWVVVIASVIGGLTHYRQGTVDLTAAKWLAPTALPGAALGAIAAAFMSGRTLQVVFAILLVLIGIQMLATARRRLRKERLDALTVAVESA
ncbi:MAG: sulfite exporter TauE/SafE family protein [Tepidiformaceae bacterium]